MPYTAHFKLADDMIVHLDTVIGGVTDPFIQTRYVGFVTVAAVTVYELAIKEIFIEFATKKHKVLGTFTRSHFERINGRIKLEIIREEYVARFGDKYKLKFKQKLEEAEIRFLRSQKVSIKSSYNNLVTWRNEFAHGGTIPLTASYSEVKRSYELDVRSNLAYKARFGIPDQYDRHKRR
jgi:hypothetical protein